MSERLIWMKFKEHLDCKPNNKPYNFGDTSDEAL